MRQGLGSSPTLFRAVYYSAPPPVVVAVSYAVVDTAGGGQRVVVQVDDSTNCISIMAGEVPFTSFAIDDATHVSGVPGPHAAGVVNVIVTSSMGGPSVTGIGLIEYWSPTQLTGIDAYYDSGKDVGVTGANINTWKNQVDGINATSASTPTLVSAIFGSLPAIRFVPQNRLGIATPFAHTAGLSYFAVLKWTSTDAVPSGAFSAPPMSIVGYATQGWNGWGLSAGQLDYAQYNAGNNFVLRGAALNDGVARLVGVTDAINGDIKQYAGATQQGATANVLYSANNGVSVIGNGYGTVDGLDADMGTLILMRQPIDPTQHSAKLNPWAKQRFGTP